MKDLQEYIDDNLLRFYRISGETLHYSVRDKESIWCSNMNVNSDNYRILFKRWSKKSNIIAIKSPMVEIISSNDAYRVCQVYTTFFHDKLFEDENKVYFIYQIDLNSYMIRFFTIERKELSKSILVNIDKLKIRSKIRKILKDEIRKDKIDKIFKLK